MIATRKELDETDHKIIQDIKSGHAYKEIAHRLKITVPMIKYRIKLMKKEFKSKSLAELVCNIYK